MDHVHESPGIMLKPLILLALGAVFSGMIGYHMLGLVSPEGVYWQNSIASFSVIEEAHHVAEWVGTLPLLLALSGIGLAWYFYIVNLAAPVNLAGKFPTYTVSS